MYSASPISIVGRRPIRSHIRPHTTTPKAKARKNTDRVCAACCGPTAKARPMSARAGLYRVWAICGNISKAMANTNRFLEFMKTSLFQDNCRIAYEVTPVVLSRS
ncbi:hypothetical protein D3C81_1749480 [compost metagenome]